MVGGAETYVVALRKRGWGMRERPGSCLWPCWPLGCLSCSDPPLPGVLAPCPAGPSCLCVCVYPDWSGAPAGIRCAPEPDTDLTLSSGRSWVGSWREEWGHRGSQWVVCSSLSSGGPWFPERGRMSSRHLAGRDHEHGSLCHMCVTSLT